MPAPNHAASNSVLWQLHEPTNQRAAFFRKEKLTCCRKDCLLKLSSFFNFDIHASNEHRSDTIKLYERWKARGSDHGMDKLAVFLKRRKMTPLLSFFFFFSLWNDRSKDSKITCSHSRIVRDMHFVVAKPKPAGLVNETGTS